MKRRALATILAAWWACAACAQSLPSPKAQTLVADVRLAEQRARDERLSARERESAAVRAIELRRELLDEIGPSDPRVPEWMATQAAALLAELARDASDTSALLGLPTPAQRLAVGRAADEADRLLERGVRLADEQWQRLGGVGSEKPGADALEQLVTVRFPFTRARALVLRAAMASGAERQQLARLAGEQISRLELVLPGPEAARRVNLALAFMLRDDGSEASAVDEAGRALAAGDAVATATRVEAWLVVLAAASQRDPEALAAVNAKVEEALRQPPLAVRDGDEWRVDALVGVLVADAQTRQLWARGLRERSPALLGRAIAVQERLLARDDLTVRGGREGVLGPVVYDKLARLELPAPDAEGKSIEVPPLVRLARAVLSSREDGGRVLALASLTALADAEDATGENGGAVAGEALWERAVLLLQAADPGDADRLEAASALIALAERMPDHPRARVALPAGLMHARGLALAGSTEAAGLYRRGLVLATERPDASELEKIDLWRYERGRLAVDAGRDAGADDARALAELLSAAGHVRQIGIDRGLDEPLKAADVLTLGEHVHEAAVDRLWLQVRAARRAGREDRVRQIAAERLAVEAQRAAAWARSAKSTLRDRFEADLADALVEAGDAGAAGWYEALLRPGPDGAERVRSVPGGSARLELGLARARLIQGDDARAFALLKVAGERTDIDLNGPGTRGETFWHAWTLTLEVLVRQNAGGERAGTIRAQVRRLEAIDRSLGGEPWATRIRAAERAAGAPAAPAR